MGQEILECYSYPGLKTWVETSGNLPNFEIHVLSAGRLFVVFCCLFFTCLGTGRYYGSDAVRSPMDRYRSPGAPPYEGP